MTGVYIVVALIILLVVTRWYKQARCTCPEVKCPACEDPLTTTIEKKKKNSFETFATSVVEANKRGSGATLGELLRGDRDTDLREKRERDYDGDDDDWHGTYVHDVDESGRQVQSY